MDTIDIELGRAEQELQHEEAALATELTRMEAAASETEGRLQRLRAAAHEAQNQGETDAGLSMRLASTAVPRPRFADAQEQARLARRAAVDARRATSKTVRLSLQTWKTQLMQVSQQLQADEKIAERLVGQAKAKARAPQPVRAQVAPPPPAPGLMDATDLRPLPPTPAAPPAALDATYVRPQPAAPLAPPHMQPKAPAAPPKRASPRVKMTAAVELSSDTNFFSGFSANISDGGLFIATLNLLPLGTPVDLNFSLPSGERVECKGIVRWTRDVNDKYPDAFPGIGVQFTDIDHTSQMTIAKFVQSREPLFYEGD